MLGIILYREIKSSRLYESKRHRLRLRLELYDKYISERLKLINLNLIRSAQFCEQM